MSEFSFSRLSAVAAITSGLLSLLAASIAMVGIFVPVIPDLINFILIMVTDLFIFVVLIGLFIAQYREIGWLGFKGLLLAIFGLPAAVIFPLAGYPLFLVGIFLFAIASTLSAKFQAWGMWLWFLGASIAIPAGFLSWSIFFAFGLVIAAGGRALLGLAIWRKASVIQ